MGTSQLSVSWIEPPASDASGDVRLSDITHSPGDNFLVGSTRVKYTFVDGSDNSASCEFVIHIYIGKKLTKNSISMDESKSDRVIYL